MKRLSVHHHDLLCLDCQGCGVWDCPPSEGYVHVGMLGVVGDDGWTVRLDGEDVTDRCVAVRVIPNSRTWHNGWVVLLADPLRPCARCGALPVHELWYSDDVSISHRAPLVGAA